MTRIILAICLMHLLALNNAFSQEIKHVDTAKDNIQTDLIRHLKILDEASKNAKEDTIYCCVASINFLERETLISAGTIGNIIGTFGFTKEALMQWYKWYEKKYGK